MKPVITTEIFIQRARAIHGDRYDYSKVEYTVFRNPVCIICPEHGDFLQKPSLHLSGSGCPICAGKAQMKTPHFIRKAQEVHGNKYDYSQTIFSGRQNEVEIICPTHGVFRQRAANHLNGHGCPQCGRLQSSSSQKVWTESSCFAEAKKYLNVGDFLKNSQSAYTIAARNGWLQQYTWLDRKKVPNGYWTEERVIEEAHKYVSRHDFLTKSPGAFNAANNLGLLSTFTWFSPAKNAKKWNRESCFEEAKNYTSKHDFRISSYVAYCKARDNGWLTDYSWFVEPKVWNYNRCLEEAKRYTYYTDFRYSSPDAFLAASKRGWLSLYTWLVKEKQEAWNKKWNYESCYQEALKYKTRGEFSRCGAGAYDIARKNGWLPDYGWFPDLTKSDSKVDSVYRYFFPQSNAIYVGRTLMYRQHMRDVEHRRLSSDRVLKYALEHNCPIPPIEIIEENLTIQEGRIREDYWRHFYEEQGCFIINEGATGENSGSIGALASGKWTFEKAYDIALNFQSVKEMCEEYEYLYKISKARGWLEKFDWFRGAEIKIEKQTVWTEDVCRQEALKYKTRSEFRSKCRGAYDKARDSGWLDTYDWLSYPKKIIWDYDNCKEEAAKYSGKYDFQKGSYTAYKHAYENGWLDEFFPSPKRRLLDYDTCKRLASQYSSSSELLKNDRSLYNTIDKKGWLTIFFEDNSK